MYDSRIDRRAVKPSKDTKKWESVQLQRLACSLLLFLAVFLGKQVYPSQIMTAGERVLYVLSESIDLEALLSDLRHSIERETGIFGELESLCTEVFGLQPVSDAEQAQEIKPYQLSYPSVHSGLLTQTLAERKFYTAYQAKSVVESAEPECVPTVGTVVAAAEVSDLTLPDGYTADKLSFGDLETVSPVLGHLNSGFGYRDHPVNGKYSFHCGADISAASGDPIAAFADGVVEYVGKDNTYGLYLQLDHGSEIKSFYAHCQSVCVKKGQYVKVGDTVALVGATGRATGPHLHLELKCCGLRVDPAYYVDFL